MSDFLYYFTTIQSMQFNFDLKYEFMYLTKMNFVGTVIIYFLCGQKSCFGLDTFILDS